MVQKQMWHNTDPVLFTIFFTFGDIKVVFFTPFEKSKQTFFSIDFLFFPKFRDLSLNGKVYYMQWDQTCERVKSQKRFLLWNCTQVTLLSMRRWAKYTFFWGAYSFLHMRMYMCLLMQRSLCYLKSFVQKRRALEWKYDLTSIMKWLG